MAEDTRQSLSDLASLQQGAQAEGGAASVQQQGADTAYREPAPLREQKLDVAQKGWSVLHRATRKIRSLVENILNYTRQTQLAPKPVDLNQMVGAWSG